MEKYKLYPHDKRYKVLHDGNVIGPKGSILKPAKNNSGYKFIAVGGVCKTIHRMVALAWIDNPDNKEYVNHKDGNKDNNSVINLEWTTRSENEKHAFKSGLKNHKGERGPAAKLKEYQVGIIKEADNLKYPRKEVAKYFNISIETISGIVNGHKWKHLL